MMRSLFSGVAGLKTHQTRMDVIGNNIANVNTTAYKSQSMTFSDLMYQSTQALAVLMQGRLVWALRQQQLKRQLPARVPHRAPTIPLIS